MAHIGFQIKTKMAHTLGIDVDKTKLCIDRCYIFSSMLLVKVFVDPWPPFYFFRFS